MKVTTSSAWTTSLPAARVKVVGYQYDPVQTTKTSVHGAINMLGLAKRTKARILQASTSEVYGDPDEHPQPESYWGRVNPIGPRSCYDEGKRCAETLFSTIIARTRLKSKGYVSLTPTGHACIPTTAGWSVTSLYKRSKERISPSTATASKLGHSVTWMT